MRQTLIPELLLDPYDFYVAPVIDCLLDLLSQTAIVQSQLCNHVSAQLARHALGSSTC